MNKLIMHIIHKQGSIQNTIYTFLLIIVQLIQINTVHHNFISIS
jgi:hypothetical protein